MKFKCGECLLLALFMFFIELIKRCCPLPSSIQMVDPLIIKINIEKFENISLIILLNYTTENRSGKKLILQQVSDQTVSKEIYSKEEKDQDQINKRKIEFNFIQKDFERLYGKFNLSYIDGNPIYYNQTIFIYTNDLILKNPKKKYFLTGQDRVDAKYDFSLPIILDEINNISYYEESNPNTKQFLSKDDYGIENVGDNTKLLLNFPRNNSPSSYIFDIFPEYDKNTSNPEIQRFYLYFHDYLLNNDAIYINKNNNTNEVSFNLTFRYNFNSALFSIRENSREIFYLSSLLNNNYEITINLGRKYSPGKVSISYNGQERELFYILYDSNFQRCYEKDDIMDLIITMEWIDEMEYDHMLYFNDTTTKLLTSSYAGKSGSTVIYKYKYSTLSLNSGIFSLKSTIPSLNYSSSYNPVDNNHLYFFIYPDTMEQQF